MRAGIGRRRIRSGLYDRKSNDIGIARLPCSGDGVTRPGIRLFSKRREKKHGRDSLKRLLKGCWVVEVTNDHLDALVREALGFVRVMHEHTHLGTACEQLRNNETRNVACGACYENGFVAHASNVVDQSEIAKILSRGKTAAADGLGPPVIANAKL